MNFTRAFAVAITALALIGAAVAQDTEPGWVLFDHHTSEVLASGEGFAAEDVQVVDTRDGRAMRRVYHTLVDDYQAGISIFSDDDPKNMLGFGLWLQRSEHLTFSWDWFNVTAPGAAYKIQGGGAVTYEIGKVDGRLQMTSITVVEDITLRSKDTADESTNVLRDPNGLNNRWTCLIRAGTVIPLKRQE